MASRTTTIRCPKCAKQITLYYTFLCFVCKLSVCYGCRMKIFDEKNNCYQQICRECYMDEGPRDEPNAYNKRVWHTNNYNNNKQNKLMCDSPNSKTFQTNMKEAKNADPITEKSVFGYINKIEKILIFAVPISIKLLCLLFYYEPEEYVKCDESIILSTNQSNLCKNIATYIKKLQFHNVYGKYIIDAQKYKHCIFQWSLRYNKISECGRGISIGIWGLDGKEEYILDRCCFNPFRNWRYYSWTGHDLRSHQRNNHGPYPAAAVKQNDIIDLEVNIDEKQLKYFKNGKDLGIAFNNLDFSITYKLVLAFGWYGKGAVVEIVNFKIREK